jgi:vacuolar protein sorting-associated protein 72
MEDQDGADTEFWNQDFFAEEGKDDEYATESESEDKADTDFSGSEEDDDEEGGDGAEAKERCTSTSQETLFVGAAQPHSA